MAGIKHAFTSLKSDSADTTLVRPVDWNADHTITGDVQFNGFNIPTSGATFSITLDSGGTPTGIINTSETQVIIAGDLVPISSDSESLGVTGTRFSDLFLADGAVINLGTTSSRATITHTAASDSI